MPNNDIAISIRDLSKAYKIRHDKIAHVTLAEEILAKVRRPFGQSRGETFWAVRDMNLDIEHGETLGIIGHNGAGKSTMLKLLSRITTPTTGRIDLYGRVGSLLEVGTGFHPELTGRENIFLNGTILGMRRAEITKQFDAIVEFAGVEKFLDTPVKRYSSGMFVRLAFAVAAHLNPEILIVDEVLSVGDAEFRNKCIGKMKDVAESGRTVLFVSHNLATLRNLCRRTIMMRQGRMVSDGTTADVIEDYLSCLAERLTMPLDQRHDRSGSGEVRTTCLSLYDANGSPTNVIEPGSPFEVEIQLEASKRCPGLICSIDIDTMEGQRVTSLFSKYTNQSFDIEKGASSLRVRAEGLDLRPGQFLINVLLGHPYGVFDLVLGAGRFDAIDNDFYGTGQIHTPECGVVASRYTWERSGNGKQGRVLDGTALSELNAHA